MELVAEKVNQLFNPENFPPIAGHKCIARWDFISMFHGFYEIPTRVVRPLLPRGIEPVEVRPGISLYDIGHAHWNEGNLRGQWPEFHEITVMLVVHPDLSVDMPMSKFCFFVLKIAANCHPFVENEARTLHLPTAFTPLHCRKSDDPTAVTLSDDQKMMFFMRSTNPNPTFHEDDFYGQYYTAKNGKLWFGPWRWQGTLCEHQKQGDHGGLVNHRLLYGDIDVERDCTELYIQMYTEPGKRCIETFYEPRLVGTM
jgi:hypothetical protein